MLLCVRDLSLGPFLEHWNHLQTTKPLTPLWWRDVFSPTDTEWLMKSSVQRTNLRTSVWQITLGPCLYVPLNPFYFMVVAPLCPLFECSSETMKSSRNVWRSVRKCSCLVMAASDALQEFILLIPWRYVHTRSKTAAVQRFSQHLFGSNGLWKIRKIKDYKEYAAYLVLPRHSSDIKPSHASVSINISASQGELQSVICCIWPKYVETKADQSQNDDKQAANQEDLPEPSTSSFY